MIETNLLRTILNEAVVKIGNEKYLSWRGKFYHYDADGNRTEISKKDYDSVVGGDRVQAAAQRKTPKKIKTYNHGMDIGTDDEFKSSKSKEDIKSHFISNIKPILPDDVEESYQGLGGGVVYLSTTRGTTSNPVDVFASIQYNSDGTLTYDALAEDKSTGREVSIFDIPIRSLDDIDDMIDRTGRGVHDKWKDKDEVEYKDFQKQENRLRGFLLLNRDHIS